MLYITLVLFREKFFLTALLRKYFSQRNPKPRQIFHQWGVLQNRVFPEYTVFKV